MSRSIRIVAVVFVCCFGGLMAAPALGDGVMSLSGPTQAFQGDTGLLYESYAAADEGTITVRGYQVTFPCSMTVISGTGTVDYVAGSIAIDPDHPDYIFNHGVIAFPVTAPGDCSIPDLPRLSNSTMFASDARVVGTDPMYLGEIQYDVGAATGTHELCIEPYPPPPPLPPWIVECLTLTIIPCATDEDCDDGELCTLDTCVGAPNGVCEHTYCPSPFADIVWWRACEEGAAQQPDLRDIICIIDAYVASGDWRDVCPEADIYMTVPEPGCGSDGLITLDDIIAVLDAFAGTSTCPAPCP